MKGHKYSRTVLTILALSFGSASLQANPRNPLIGSTIPLTTHEDVFKRDVDYDQRHGAGDFNALHKWLTDIPKEIRDQLIKGQMSQEDFEAYGEMRVRDRWLQMSRTGKILFFNYCPTEMRLEFFKSLTPQEQVVALQHAGPHNLLKGAHVECWKYASDDVREAAAVAILARMSPVSRAAYAQELTLMIPSMQKLGKFLSLAGKGVSSPAECANLGHAYDELNKEDQVKHFATLAEAGTRFRLMRDSLEHIWKNRLNDLDKARNFQVLVDYCTEDNSEVAKIVEDYRYLYEQGYGTYVDEDGNEISLFSVLSDDVKKELFKPFFKRHKDDKESAMLDFLVKYNKFGNIDEEDLDFIDDLYDEEDSDD